MRHLTIISFATWHFAASPLVGLGVTAQMEYVFGFGIAIVISVMASLVGLDKERGIYPVVLIVIASYFVLFAVIGASASAYYY